MNHSVMESDNDAEFFSLKYPGRRFSEGGPLTKTVRRVRL